MSINPMLLLVFQYFLSQFGNHIIISPQFGSVFSSTYVNNNVQNNSFFNTSLNFINNSPACAIQLEYNKYLIGVNVGLLNSGFEYNLPTNSTYIATSRLAFGLGLEIPISMFSINKYDVGDSFWDYFHEEEKQKKLHFQPNFGIGIAYLFNVSGYNKQNLNLNGNEIEYNNNLNSNILIRPYFLLAIKNADLEYCSLSFTYSLGLLPAEQLKVKDESSNWHRFTTTNSAWTIAISRKFYWRIPNDKLKNKSSNEKKYKGQCPEN